MIRLAVPADLPRIHEIYARARSYMEHSGNPTQWGNFYPPADLIADDIEKKQLFVYTENREIHGVFAFIIGEDETYLEIEDGAWLHDAPYGAIHRVASSGQVRGMFSQCIAFCKQQIPDLRIDTHHDNVKMQRLVESEGFVRCGIIYVLERSPRIAYHYTPAK